MKILKNLGLNRIPDTSLEAVVRCGGEKEDQPCRRTLKKCEKNIMAQGVRKIIVKEFVSV